MIFWFSESSKSHESSKKNGNISSSSLEEKPEFKKLLSNSPPPTLSPSAEPPEPEDLVKGKLFQESNFDLHNFSVTQILREIKYAELSNLSIDWTEFFEKDIKFDFWLKLSFIFFQLFKI